MTTWKPAASKPTIPGICPCLRRPSQHPTLLCPVDATVRAILRHARAQNAKTKVILDRLRKEYHGQA